MATYYWVGGDGNWSDATNHWSNASGGSPSASYLPTSADDVVFDAASNTGTGAFTVTVDGTSASPSLCADFSTGGAGGALDGAMTLSLGATAQLDCYGSMTLPATNFTWSGTATASLRFVATSTGKTVTTNGVSLTNTGVTFNGVGGGWTLGSAITTTSGGITIAAGAFDSANYSITTPSLVAGSGSSTRSLTLGSSAVTLSLSGTAFSYTGTNFTLNAGTSTITCSSTSPTFNGGGLIYYNVNFSGAGLGTTTITGVNTFNNLTQASRSADGPRQVIFSNSQTINGTLTLGAANTSTRRIQVYGTESTGTGVGTAITLTVATIATLADVDFRDITAAGASGTWSGTRLGNGGGNSNITFVAGKTVYWNLAAGGIWSNTAWALSSGGATNANNFPLAQDTAIIEDTGLTAGNTITISVGWWLGTINAGSRTLAFTLASGTQTPRVFGSLTLPSVATVTGTGSWFFAANNSTQNITTNGVSIPFPINCNGSTTNTVKLIGNLTSTNTVTFQQGTLDLNNNTLTCTTFTSSNAITRSIAFGTGNITVSGNNTTVWSCATLTNFSYTGTPTVNFTYSGSTGTRTVTNGSIGGTETNAVDFNVTAGTDTWTSGGSAPIVRNLNFTGFSGASGFFSSGFIYGNVTLSPTQTVIANNSATTFAATSGTKTITTNGVTIDRPLTFDGVGGTWACQDALTLGSTRTLTITNGTLRLKAGATSTVGMFATSGTNQKYFQSTTPGTQATISDASGTISVSYLTIQDINATGGAIWNAYYQQGNIDAGNNTGWYFGETPTIGAEVTMRLRSFTEPRRF